MQGRWRIAATAAVVMLIGAVYLVQLQPEHAGVASDVVQPLQGALETASSIGPAVIPGSERGLTDRSSRYRSGIGEPDGVLNRSIRKLEKSREEDPSNRDATYWLSAAYIATGQTDLAREFTREARSQFANDTDIAILYALVLYHDRDLSGAERELRRVLNIHPDNAVAALNLGLVLMEADRVAEARSVLEQVINAYPGEPLGLRARSILDKKSGD